VKAERKCLCTARPRTSGLHKSDSSRCLALEPAPRAARCGIDERARSPRSRLERLDRQCTVHRHSINGTNYSHIAFTWTWRGPRSNHSKLRTGTCRVQVLPGDPNRIANNGLGLNVASPPRERLSLQCLPPKGQVPFAGGRDLTTGADPPLGRDAPREGCLCYAPQI
jgi:hypothetical protein